MPYVIAKVIFDHVALVPETEDEVLMPVGRVGFHDVPKDRTISNRQHGLGTKLGFFAQASAFASAQNDNFHRWSDLWDVIEGLVSKNWALRKSDLATIASGFMPYPQTAGCRLSCSFEIK